MRYITILFTALLINCGTGSPTANEVPDAMLDGTVEPDGAAEPDASTLDSTVEPDAEHQPCGNGTIEPGEQCDGQNFGAVDCELLSFAAGELACTQDCQLDTSGCTNTPPECGNGIQEPGEQCDGLDLQGQTCGSQGYQGGLLACYPNCSGFDVTDCWNVQPECGNGIQEPGEQCDDGNHVLSDQCPDGPLGTCLLASCGDGFVWAGVEDCDDGNHSTTDDCPDGPNGTCEWTFCGDGFVHGLDEQCDFAADPLCHDDCQGACGDGVMDGWPYETCDDGNNTDDATCYGDCSGRCGDGIVHDGITVDQGYGIVFPDHGEECDGGWECNPDCTVSVCGDGICWGPEEDDCNLDCDCVALGGIVCAWGGCCYPPSPHPQHPNAVAQCCQYGCVQWGTGWANCGSCGNNCATLEYCSVSGTCI